MYLLDCIDFCRHSTKLPLLRSSSRSLSKHFWSGNRYSAPWKSEIIYKSSNFRFQVGCFFSFLAIPFLRSFVPAVDSFLLPLNGFHPGGVSSESYSSGLSGFNPSTTTEQWSTSPQLGRNGIYFFRFADRVGWFLWKYSAWEECAGWQVVGCIHVFCPDWGTKTISIFPVKWSITPPLPPPPKKKETYR